MACKGFHSVLTLIGCSVPGNDTEADTICDISCVDMYICRSKSAVASKNKGVSWRREMKGGGAGEEENVAFDVLENI